LGTVGGVLMVCAGVLVMVAADRRRRMGTAYETPAAQRAAARARAAAGDPADWWRALDAGLDPTEKPPAVPGPDLPASAATMDEPSGSQTREGDGGDR
jgi:hypothetical protein